MREYLDTSHMSPYSKSSSHYSCWQSPSTAHFKTGLSEPDTHTTATPLHMHLEKSNRNNRCRTARRIFFPPPHPFPLAAMPALCECTCRCRQQGAVTPEAGSTSRVTDRIPIGRYGTTSGCVPQRHVRSSKCMNYHLCEL